LPVPYQALLRLSFGVLRLLSGGFLHGRLLSGRHLLGGGFFRGGSLLGRRLLGGGLRRAIRGLGLCRRTLRRLLRGGGLLAVAAALVLGEEVLAGLVDAEGLLRAPAGLLEHGLPAGRAIELRGDVPGHKAAVRAAFTAVIGIA